MAQTLSKNDSSAKVKRAVRRHLRLTRRTADENAVAIANRIVASAEALDKALQAAKFAAEAAEDAFDDWNQGDQRLDQAVRRIHLRCLDWDATHRGAETAKLVFGGMAPSEVTNAPRHKEPDLVAKMVVRGRELPADHPAAPFFDKLQDLADASRAAHRAWIDASQNVGAANTNAEMAKLVVVRAYRDGYIDIERACGATVADSCFPMLRRPRKAAPDEVVLDLDIEEEEA